MINLYNKNHQLIEYTLTEFPDGSKNAWKIKEPNVVEVEWIYENDSELMTLLQILHIIPKIQNEIPILNIPFFPHARQDKDVSNETTFSKKIICDVLFKHYKHLYLYINTIDIHSSAHLGIFNERLNNIIPDFLSDINYKYDLICFPDKGASKRGYNTHDIPYFSLDKIRNQLTGEITGLTCLLPLDLTGKSIIIADDICDGGKTFIEACKLLKKMGAFRVDLYTSHGIYSKGIDVLRDSGIDNIYNRKGIVL